MAGSKKKSTTDAVRVGTAKKGTFGKRVAGVAGREATGGRGGMTDAAIKSGSNAYGRSSPGTAIGGAGGSTGGGSFREVTSKTTNPGGGLAIPTQQPATQIGRTPTSGGGGGGDVPEPSVTPLRSAPYVAPLTQTVSRPTTTTAARTTTTTVNTKSPRNQLSAKRPGAGKATPKPTAKKKSPASTLAAKRKTTTMTKLKKAVAPKAKTTGSTTRSRAL